MRLGPATFRWLASYPKSGNTWVRMFLAAYASGGSLNINALPAAVSLGDGTSDVYQAVCPYALDTMDPKAQTLIRGAVLAFLSTMGKPPILLKTHVPNRALYSFPLIPDYWTHSAIYVHRDPRDLVSSYAAHMGITVEEAITAMSSDDTLNVGGNIYTPLGSWNEHVKSWLDKPGFPVLGLKYESLVADPETEFRDLLKFYGLEVDEVVLRRAIKATSLKKLKAQEKKNGFFEATKNSQFFRKGEVGGWENELSDDQVRRIETATGEMMERLGYKLATQ